MFTEFIHATEKHTSTDCVRVRWPLIYILHRDKDTEYHEYAVKSVRGTGLSLTCA